MSDKMVTTFVGMITSVMVGVKKGLILASVINYEELLQVSLYGFFGGLAGYFAKKIGECMILKIKKLTNK